MKKIAMLIATVLALSPVVASAQQVAFTDAWKEQRFAIFGSNDFSLGGNTLGVTSNGTVSLLWTALPTAMQGKTQAAWNWSVDTSVPATDLSRKGGDDRNLALYFIFLPETAAQTARNAGVRALLDNPDVRVLMYIWGGSHSAGQIVPSPYLGARGRSVILRPAGTGSASERVNLAQDHQRAFGEAAKTLVGLAVSSGSDDTKTRVAANISGLQLQ
jgi:hypothetical protein